MAMSKNAAPSWRGLLEQICDSHIKNQDFKDAVFSKSGGSHLLLEEAAQIIGLELARKDISLHEEVAALISKVKLSGSFSETKKFLSEKPLRVVTTNYDKLLEELAGDECLSLCPGRPVPRSDARVKVYHVHGSIDVPNKMVITADDYFNFMHSESYFSRKLSTILHENTVVILGYSLGDTNLKAILNEYRGFVRSHAVSNSVFLVSRSKINQRVADYYSNSYGIRVIPDTEIEDFFTKLAEQKSDVSTTQRTLKTVKNVLNNNYLYKESYISIEISFYEIIAAFGAIGADLKQPRVEKVVADIISKKSALCGKSGAWDQYVHLASWLTYLGTLVDVRGTSIEATYLDSVKYSMEHMTRTKRLGYSWGAYEVWDTRWNSLTADNRAMIAKFIADNSTGKDATEVTSRG